MRPRFLALALAVLFACSREQKRPERTEPWPAPSAAPSGSTAPVDLRARYELEKSDLRFELPAKHASPRGRLTAATGQFEIDFEHLEGSSGSVRVDLGSIELDGSGDDGRTADGGTADGGIADRTRRALEWLELGAEVPQADRDARRFATFVFLGLDDRRSAVDFFRHGKQRPIEGSVIGDLSLHGMRAPLRVPASLELGPPAGPGKPPGRLVIRSLRPLVVSLGVHDIRPRDARGVLVARELTLLGETVGREAKLDFELTLALRP